MYSIHVLMYSFERGGFSISYLQILRLKKEEKTLNKAKAFSLPSKVSIVNEMSLMKVGKYHETETWKGENKIRGYC